MLFEFSLEETEVDQLINIVVVVCCGNTGLGKLEFSNQSLLLLLVRV